MKSAKEFLRSVVYTSKPSKNYLDARLRIYKNLKRKTSKAISPDPDLVDFAIKRAHLRTFTW